MNAADKQLKEASEEKSLLQSKSNQLSESVMDIYKRHFSHDYEFIKIFDSYLRYRKRSPT